MDTIRPEDLPEILEKRSLDSHTQAWMLENGTVLIVNSAGGIEASFTPERAYNLVNFLSKHSMTLLRILRPKTLTLNWQHFEDQLLVCLRVAYERFGYESTEPWRVSLLRPTLAPVFPGEYTPKQLLQLVTETQGNVAYGNATLFYDDQYIGQEYQGKRVFGSLYLETEHTDQPLALFYRLDEAQK